MANMRELPKHPGSPPEPWERMAQYEDCPACGAELWVTCKRAPRTPGALVVWENPEPPVCPARIDAARQRFTEEWLDACERRRQWWRDGGRALAQGTQPGTERLSDQERLELEADGWK